LIPAATTTNPITPARVIGTWAKAAAPDWTGPVVLAAPPAVVVVEEELLAAPPVVVVEEDELLAPPVEVVEEDELEVLVVMVEAMSVAVVLLVSVTKMEELVLIVAVVTDVPPNVSEVEVTVAGAEEDDSVELNDTSELVVIVVFCPHTATENARRRLVERSFIVRESELTSKEKKKSKGRKLGTRSYFILYSSCLRPQFALCSSGL